MYGGVSLAVYINGVTQEFFRAVHGRRIYRLIKAITDSDVVVDAISGTSAGGINGILLAYALANGREFASTSVLWRLHGGIGRLLRRPFEEVPERSSLLDSEGYYQQRLEEAFADMPPLEPEREDRQSPIEEIDLFVTGTDVDGRVWTDFDDAGHEIEVKDHRAVFNLKYRRGRKNQFEPLGFGVEATPHAYADENLEARRRRRAATSVVEKALAKLARITSCFPVAFSPVLVGRREPLDADLRIVPANDNEVEELVDGYLQFWGRLDKECCFLDGGVLDNKPFTHTIKAIFSRTADREVSRRLCYVEPDPETFRRRTAASQPHFAQSAMAALVGIPSYESIADDLRVLAEHNSRLTRYRRLVDSLRQNSGKVEAASQVEQELYRQARLSALAERVIHGLLGEHGHLGWLEPAQRERAKHLDQQLKSNLVANRDLAGRVLRQFDVTFHQRRAHHIAYWIHRRLYGNGPARGGSPETLLDRQQARQAWGLCNGLIQLSEIVRWGLEKLIDGLACRDNETPEELWIRVDHTLNYFLDAAAAANAVGASSLPQWVAADALERLHSHLGARAEKARRAEAELPSAPVASLLEILDDMESSHFRQLGEDHPLCGAFDEFTHIDTLLYPLQMVSGFEERDIIKTVRISPRDAQRGFSNLDFLHKVSGDTFFHFGGFFKRSWRSNDILWGRLDGACQLAEILLEPDDPERLTALQQDQKAREIIRARCIDATSGKLKAELRASTLFPRSGPVVQSSIDSWVMELLDGEAAALERARLSALVTTLIEAEQLEILAEELPRVTADAIEEQVEWNRFQQLQPPRFSRPARRALNTLASALRPTQPYSDDSPALPWVFKPAREARDSFVSAAAVAEIARTSVGALAVAAQEAPGAERPLKTPLGQFFQQVYKVGREQVDRDIPQVVLVEWLARALLITQTCFLKLLPDNGRPLRSNPAYKLGIDLPLRALYSLALLTRRSPRLAQAIVIVGAVALAMLIAFTIWGGPARTGTDGDTWVAIFMLAPAVVLLSLLGHLANSRRLIWILTLASAVILLWFAVEAPIDETGVRRAVRAVAIGTLVIHAGAYAAYRWLAWKESRRYRRADQYVPANMDRDDLARALADWQTVNDTVIHPLARREILRCFLLDEQRRIANHSVSGDERQTSSSDSYFGRYLEALQPPHLRKSGQPLAGALAGIRGWVDRFARRSRTRAERPPSLPRVAWLEHPPGEGCQVTVDGQPLRRARYYLVLAGDRRVGVLRGEEASVQLGERSLHMLEST
jgi:hypothetical protein